MHDDIIQCFTQHPFDESNNRIVWFNVVATQLFKFHPLKPTAYDPVEASALVAWKDAGSGPITYSTPVGVIFNQLYLQAMLALPNDYTVVDFHTRLNDLFEARKLCKQRKNTDVQYSIKAFINTIFGQMNAGLVRHATASREDIVLIGRRVMQSLYDHPAAVYADTDEVVFNGLTVEEVGVIVNETVDVTAFPCEVTPYDSVEVRGKKNVIYTISGM